MKCYVCENEMEFIQTKELAILGEVKEYKCNTCGEIVYQNNKSR